MKKHMHHCIYFRCTSPNVTYSSTDVEQLLLIKNTLCLHHYRRKKESCRKLSEANIIALFSNPDSIFYQIAKKKVR